MNSNSGLGTANLSSKVKDSYFSKIKTEATSPQEGTASSSIKKEKRNILSVVTEGVKNFFLENDQVNDGNETSSTAGTIESNDKAVVIEQIQQPANIPTQPTPPETSEQNEEAQPAVPLAIKGMVAEPTAEEIAIWDETAYATIISLGYPESGELDETTEEKERIDNQPFDPASETGKFLILLECAHEVKIGRFLKRQLSLPREQRKVLNKLGKNYSQRMLSVLNGAESKNWEVFVQQLPRDNAQSLLRFLNFKYEDLLFPISKTNMYEVNSRFVEPSIQFLRSTFSTLTDVTQIDGLVNYINEKRQAYYGWVDIHSEARMNFPTKWLNEVHTFAIPLAVKDMEPCLAVRDEVLDMDEAEIRFDMICTAADIAQRLVLSVDMKLKLLDQFRPVLNSFIAYTQKMPVNKRVNQMQSTALDIQEKFYEQPLEMFIPLFVPTEEKEEGTKSEPETQEEEVKAEVPANINMQSAENEESEVTAEVAAQPEIPAGNNTQNTVNANEEEDKNALTAEQKFLAEKLGLTIDTPTAILYSVSGDARAVIDVKIKLQKQLEARGAITVTK